MRARLAPILLLSLLLRTAGCGDDAAVAPDTGRPPDAVVADDSGPAVDNGGQLHDSGGYDAVKPADATPTDMAAPADAAIPSDAAVPPDAAIPPDKTVPPDKALPPDGPPNTTGLTVPCKQGKGWTLFRFHYGGSSKSPKLDVWDASCSYSYAPSSACNVYAVYPGFGSVSYTSQGYPILTSKEYLRVRFSAAGLKFTKAAVYIQARSYATASSTYYRVWSPLYGSKTNGPVDNDWIYDWYALDWTGYLKPTDKPSLTAIQIYADKGSGKLAVKAVELCVQ